MSLDKATLKAEIKNSFLSLQGKQNNNPDSPADIIAEALSNAIDKYVRNGIVKVTADSGLIQVEGSATKQANTSPIVIEGVVE